MFGKRKQKSDIIITMSMFSFNTDPVVVAVETTEEPAEITEVEAKEDFYVEVVEEDYTSAYEPDFGDDL